MKREFMQENLIRVSDLVGLHRRPDAVATVVKEGDCIYADVVFKGAAEYFRASHRDGKIARSFGAIETAVRALNGAGFAEVVVKNLDSDPLPFWIHASDDEVIRWEQELDAMGHNAPVGQLREMLAKAPAEAHGRESLVAFLSGYDRAKREG